MAHDAATPPGEAEPPASILARIEGDDSPEANWTRALCAAALGDPLRTRIALRKVVTAGPLPASALTDVAGPFARAVLDPSEVLPAWAVLAAAVHDAVGTDKPSDALHLAWELTVRAAEVADDADDDRTKAGLVCLMGAIAWRQRRSRDANQLLRGARQAAKACRDVEVYHAASLLLIELAMAEPDRMYAQQLALKSGRYLGVLGGEAAQRRFNEAAILLLQNR